MKLQAALEYLLIVGVVLALLIPIWVHVSTSQNEASGDLALSYANAAVGKLREYADMVQAQGPPAKVTAIVYFPSGLESASLVNATILLKVRTYAGLNDVYATSRANLTGALPQKDGNFLFTVEAMGSNVSITYAS